MNVCVLTWEYPPRTVGGLSRHCYALTRSLHRYGWDASVVTLSHPGAPARSEEDGVEVSRVVPPDYGDFLTWTLVYNYSLADAAVRLHERKVFDLIHAHDWMTFLAASILKHSLNLPLVTTFHSTERGRRGGIPSSFEKMINDIEWLGAYEAAQVIAVSNAIGREITQDLDVPGGKVSVVHNGMDIVPSVDGEASIKGEFASADERIVLFVGRLVREKGVEDLLEAGPSILREHPEAKLVIVGEGGLHGTLCRRADELGMSQKVYVTGRLTDHALRGLYACADVMVVPSTYEPFGYAALEGMARGVPVVAARTGGLSEIITDRVDGLLTIPGNPGSIAEAVNRLLSDRNLATAISRNGEARSRSFRSETMAAATVKVYQKAIGRA